MWIRIGQYLSAPTFEDEDKTRVATFLNTISLAILIVAVLGLAVGLVQGFAFVSSGIVLCLVLLTLGVQVLMRRGYVRPAAWLLLSAFWLLLTYLTVSSGGVRAPIVGCYVLVVVMAGLILGRTVGFGVAGLSVAVGLALVVAESHDMLPDVEAAPVIAWVIQSVHLLLVAAMVHVATRGIQGALERARGTNRELQVARAELEQRVVTEQEQREQLQRVMDSEREQRERLQRIFARAHQVTTGLSSSASEILTGPVSSRRPSHRRRPPWMSSRPSPSSRSHVPRRWRVPRNTPSKPRVRDSGRWTRRLGVCVRSGDGSRGSRRTSWRFRSRRSRLGRSSPR
jgi:hypothetical protein